MSITHVEHQGRTIAVKPHPYIEGQYYYDETNRYGPGLAGALHGCRVPAWQVAQAKGRGVEDLGLVDDEEDN